NYKNAVAPMDYEAGTLLFIVPNLAYQYNSLYGQSTNLSVTITTGANDGTHTGYDWDFLGYDNDMNSTDKTADSGTAYMIFTNSKDIEAGKTFEGSIQVKYAFTSN